MLIPYPHCNLDSSTNFLYLNKKEYCLSNRLEHPFNGIILNDCLSFTSYIPDPSASPKCSVSLLWSESDHFTHWLFLWVLDYGKRFWSVFFFLLLYETPTVYKQQSSQSSHDPPKPQVRPCPSFASTCPQLLFPLKEISCLILAYKTFLAPATFLIWRFPTLPYTPEVPATSAFLSLKIPCIPFTRPL